MNTKGARFARSNTKRHHFARSNTKRHPFTRSNTKRHHLSLLLQKEGVRGNLGSPYRNIIGLGFSFILLCNIDDRNDNTIKLHINHIPKLETTSIVGLKLVFPIIKK